MTPEWAKIDIPLNLCVPVWVRLEPTQDVLQARWGRGIDGREREQMMPRRQVSNVFTTDPSSFRDTYYTLEDWMRWKRYFIGEDGKESGSVYHYYKRADLKLSTLSKLHELDYLAIEPNVQIRRETPKDLVARVLDQHSAVMLRWQDNMKGHLIQQSEIWVRENGGWSWCGLSATKEDISKEAIYRLEAFHFPRAKFIGIDHP